MVFGSFEHCDVPSCFCTCTLSNWTLNNIFMTNCFIIDNISTAIRSNNIYFRRLNSIKDDWETEHEQ